MVEIVLIRMVAKAPCGGSTPYAGTLRLSKTAREYASSARFDRFRQHEKNGRCFVVPMHETVVHVHDPPLSVAPRPPMISAVQHFSSRTAWQLDA